MKFKDILREQSFWSLFFINVAIIIYYLYYQTGFKTLVWIYWSQSAMIGLFTFLDLATFKYSKSARINTDIRSDVESKQSKGALAFFFAFHFGFFHLVYFIFLFTFTDANEIFDWKLFQFSVGAFALDSLWNFIRMKEWEKTHFTNPKVIFFLPYARVVPMHFTILLPAFFGFISQLGLFLVLKLFTDLLMQSISLKIYGKQEHEDITILKAMK